MILYTYLYIYYRYLYITQNQLMCSEPRISLEGSRETRSRCAQPRPTRAESFKFVLANGYSKLNIHGFFVPCRFNIMLQQPSGLLSLSLSHTSPECSFNYSCNTESLSVHWVYTEWLSVTLSVTLSECSWGKGLQAPEEVKSHSSTGGQRSGRVYFVIYSYLLSKLAELGVFTRVGT